MQSEGHLLAGMRHCSHPFDCGWHPQSDCCYWLQLGSSQTGARPVLLLTILDWSPAWVLGTVTCSYRSNPLQLDPYPRGLFRAVPGTNLAWNSPTNEDGTHGYSNVGTTNGTTDLVAQQIRMNRICWATKTWFVGELPIWGTTLEQIQAKTQVTHSRQVLDTRRCRENLSMTAEYTQGTAPVFSIPMVVFCSWRIHHIKRVKTNVSTISNICFGSLLVVPLVWCENLYNLVCIVFSIYIILKYRHREKGNYSIRSRSLLPYCTGMGWWTHAPVHPASWHVIPDGSPHITQPTDKKQIKSQQVPNPTHQLYSG